MFSHLGSTADHGERAGYNLFPVAIRFFDLLRSTIRFFYPQRDAEATIGIPEITTIFSQLQEATARIPRFSSHIENNALM
jgi:hypothetical protein